MSDVVLPMSLDPAGVSPEARARAVAAILAAGLLRLRKPIILPSDTTENRSKSTANCLAESGEKSVTVSAG
jgi:hypothetical protein